jgi:hypothetical protein
MPLGAALKSTGKSGIVAGILCEPAAALGRPAARNASGSELIGPEGIAAFALELTFLTELL